MKIVIIFILVFISTISCQKEEKRYPFLLKSLDNESFLKVLYRDSTLFKGYYLLVHIKEPDIPKYDIVIMNYIFKFFMMDKCHISKEEYRVLLRKIVQENSIIYLKKGLGDSTVIGGEKLNFLKIVCNYDSIPCLNVTKNKIIFKSVDSNYVNLYKCNGIDRRCIIARLFKLRIPVTQQDVSGDLFLYKGLYKRIKEE